MDYISIIKVYRKHTFWEEISSRLQVFDCWWLCHNQGLLPLMDRNGSEGMRAVLNDAHSTCDIKLDADIFPVDVGWDSVSVSHDCNRTGNKVSGTVRNKSMMHLGKPWKRKLMCFVKKMHLVRIQFLYWDTFYMLETCHLSMLGWAPTPCDRV